jgi:uncharacterized membrane protein YsdA (DUF1294 family)
MSLPLLSAPVIVCAGLNVLAFALFAVDKLVAKLHAWRIPESPLLVLAGIGPFGSLAAMIVFRHKTRQAKFYLVPLFALLHVILILLLWSGIS